MRQCKHIWEIIIYKAFEVGVRIVFFKSKFSKISHAWQIFYKAEIDAISRNNLLFEIKEFTKCQWTDEKSR